MVLANGRIVRVEWEHVRRLPEDVVRLPGSLPNPTGFLHCSGEDEPLTPDEWREMLAILREDGLPYLPAGGKES